VALIYGFVIKTNNNIFNLLQQALPGFRLEKKYRGRNCIVGQIKSLCLTSISALTWIRQAELQKRIPGVDHLKLQEKKNMSFCL
jgi:hypothetical protein